MAQLTTDYSVFTNMGASKLQVMVDSTLFTC